jgi:hypothetical protein
MDMNYVETLHRDGDLPSIINVKFDETGPEDILFFAK